MALIKCSECSAEISDKASCCPKCGSPVAVQKQSPSVNFGVQYNNGSNPGATPEFVAKNKRNLRVRISVLVIVAFGIVIAVFTLQNNENGKSNGSNPNRTTESCSFQGTTRVFGSQHTSLYPNCHPDGDGYYWPGFGHHHHK